MVRAKNYETAFTFVKVIQRKQLASFFPGHGVFIILYADDILLLAPSVCELDALLKVCER